MDGGKRSYDKPPTDQVGDLPEADPRKPDQLPSQLTPADTQPVAPAAPSAAPSPTEEAERARNGGAPRVTDQLESDPMPPPRSTSAQPRPDAPSVPLGSEPVTLSAPLESSREHVSTLVLGPTGVAADATVFAAAANPMADESSRHLADNVREHREEPMSRAMKIAYCVVCGVLAISALGVLYVHLHHAGGHAPSTSSISNNNDNVAGYEESEHRGSAIETQSHRRGRSRRFGDELVDERAIGSIGGGDTDGCINVVQYDLCQWAGHQPGVQYVVHTDCLHVWTARRRVADRPHL